MEIRPTTNGRTPYAGGAKAGESGPAAAPATGDRRPAGSNAGAGPDATDRITISDEGRRLLEAVETAPAGAGELSPGRLDEILGRIAGGWYEKREVQRDVLSLIAADLDPGTAKPPAA